MDVLEMPSRSPALLIARDWKSALLKELINFSSSAMLSPCYLKPDDLPAFEDVGGHRTLRHPERKAYQSLISASIDKGGESIRVTKQNQKKLVDKP